MPARGDVVWCDFNPVVGSEQAGTRPAVSPQIPQEQRSDNAPVALQEELFSRVSALDGVTTRQSAISVPGARGLMLDGHDNAPLDAFLVPRAGEFAHLHPFAPQEQAAGYQALFHDLGVTFAADLGRRRL